MYICALYLSLVKPPVHPESVSSFKTNGGNDDSTVEDEGGGHGGRRNAHSNRENHKNTGNSENKVAGNVRRDSSDAPTNPVKGARDND